MHKNITWIEGEPTFTRPFTLRACMSKNGLSEGDIDPIQAWCQETGIGKRTSFDTFVFRSRADMSMFLLKWQNTEASINW
jgi:hypothetical protein